MIPIWKLTISNFRLGMPKFSKIGFTMAVDRNAVITLHKSGNSNVESAKRLDMNRSTVWKSVKKFQETENPLYWPGRGRKRSVRSPQFLKNTREKLWWYPRRSCRTLPIAAGVSKSPMHRVLRDDLGVKSLRCCIARSVMVRAAVTETGWSPLESNYSQRYIADILEGCLLPWTKKHF